MSEGWGVCVKCNARIYFASLEKQIRKKCPYCAMAGVDHMVKRSTSIREKLGPTIRTLQDPIVRL